MKFRILFSLLFLIISCSEEDTVVKPLLNYVPNNSFFVVKIENHKALINTLDTNDLLADLENSECYKNVYSKVQYLKYLSPKSESILSLTESADNQFEFLYITDETPNLITLDSIKNKKVENLKSQLISYDKITLENESFYSLKTNQKVVLSSSENLLLELKDNLSNSPSEELQKLYETTNKNKPAAVFINLENTSSLLSKITNKDFNKDIASFSNWVALDIDSASKNLSLSGVSIAEPSTFNFVDLFTNTKPVINQTAEFAPSQADAILSYTFDNYNAFTKNREQSSGIVSPVEPPMTSVEEIGVIYLKNEKAILLNTYGSEGIAEYLLSQKKAAIEYQGLEILELNKNSFLNNRFSPLIKDFEANFCVLLDNSFAFSKSQQVLKSIIRSYKSASTFNKTAIFKTLNEEIAKESSILFISKTNKLEGLIESGFTPEFSKDLKNVNLSNYGLAAQVIADKNFFHTNLVIGKNGKKTSIDKSSSRLFTVDLGAEIATNPQFVTNHITGRKEIVVQDQNNTLYLISSKGKILWKKQLTSLIQGKIKQVDIFKNGRLQLAFTTNNQFMILDRNGKEVKKFTKTYEGGNLNPIAVFDYDKKKNYRFVVTQAKHVFMYDNKAEIVKGFKFTEAEQPIIAAPKHLVISNKDFLVFKLRDGTIKLLNRVGNVRIAVNQKIDFSENEVFKYKNRFAVSDKKGVLHQIDLNGKISKTNLNFSNDHGLATTDRTLVTMNENVLTIKGKKIELELGVYTSPQIFYINNKIYVSVTDIQNEKVYLFDSQAKSIKNYPVNGSSAIDLGDIEKNKTLELLVKESNGSISVYKV